MYITFLLHYVMVEILFELFAKQITFQKYYIKFRRMKLLYFKAYLSIIILW